MVRFPWSKHSEGVRVPTETDRSSLRPAGSGPGGTDGPQRFGLLASAIAGRTVDVAPGKSGELAWTDGATVFVDPSTSPQRQLTALAVQAALLASGSLEPHVLAPLERKPVLARRYLAIEGHRALIEQERLLPPPVPAVIDRRMGCRSRSPEGSLAVARGRDSVDGPPEDFGCLRPRTMLSHRDHRQRGGYGGLHDFRGGAPSALDELTDDEDGPIVELSSPVGGGSAIGRLLKLALADARSAGGGPPGGDAPSRWSRRAVRGDVTISAAIASITGDSAPDRAAGPRFVYPEWDRRLGRYRPQWCTVVEIAPAATGSAPLALPDARSFRRPLARLATDPVRRRRRPQGDDIDIDAAVEATVGTVAGSPPDETVYVETSRRGFGLSTLVLLDVSGSAGEPGADGVPVHEHQRAAGAALAAALNELGGRVALYGFRSQGRASVQVLQLKEFDDRLDERVARRLAGLVPGAYTRLGAAVRHAATILDRDAGTSKKLLVVVSDGLAYDHGYERAHGESDARRALAEARRHGVASVCLSIGAGTDAEALQRVFGSASFARVQRTEQIAAVMGPLFRSALAVAERKSRRYERERRGRERLFLEGRRS